jgi:hypothetical protein
MTVTGEVDRRPVVETVENNKLGIAWHWRLARQ